ncbi:hypothetical protein AA0116_g7093 [Alternaria tenuissima]|nr:hypothetical protein AA0116_g7093 [Alternaria tenuissima]
MLLEKAKSLEVITMSFDEPTWGTEWEQKEKTLAPLKDIAGRVKFRLGEVEAGEELTDEEEAEDAKLKGPHTLSQSPRALTSPYAPSSPLYWNLLAFSPTSQANQVAHHHNLRAWPVPQADIALQKPPSPATALTLPTKSPAWNLLQAANYPQTTPLDQFSGLAYRLPAICRPSSCLYKPPSPTSLTPSPHSLHEIDSPNQVGFQHHGLMLQTLTKIS